MRTRKWKLTSTLRIDSAVHYRHQHTFVCPPQQLWKRDAASRALELRAPLMISTDRDQVVRRHCRTISAEGLQIRCSRKAARAIHPHETHIAPGSGPTRVLRLKLPLGDTARPLTVVA